MKPWVGGHTMTLSWRAEGHSLSAALRDGPLHSQCTQQCVRAHALQCQLHLETT